MLRTQVGLGAVKVDASGAVVVTKPLSPERRFLVRAGQQKGEIILTVLPEGVVPPSTVMSIRLNVDREDFARALTLLVD
ncbi:MAG: hypothetical protein HOW73_41985 [Polyangiaceae bacterium]|nr:hypothetical protein [Polyangiaceae bacterium]